MIEKPKKAVLVEVTDEKPYNRCIKCPQLGATCDGPNFTAMTTERLVEWIRLKKDHMGWSNGKLAEESNTPKGTVDRILAGGHTDFKMGTIAPIIKALVGGTWGKFPCPDPGNSSPDVKTLLCILETRDQEIARLNKAMDAAAEKHQAQIAHIETESEKNEQYLKALIEDMKSQLKDYRRLIINIGLLAGVLALVIIIALLIDKADPSSGFIWRAAASSMSQL